MARKFALMNRMPLYEERKYSVHNGPDVLNIFVWMMIIIYFNLIRFSSTYILQ